MICYIQNQYPLPGYDTTPPEYLLQRARQYVEPPLAIYYSLLLNSNQRLSHCQRLREDSDKCCVSYKFLALLLQHF